MAESGVRSGAGDVSALGYGLEAQLRTGATTLLSLEKLRDANM